MKINKKKGFLPLALVMKMKLIANTTNITQLDLNSIDIIIGDQVFQHVFSLNSKSGNIEVCFAFGQLNTNNNKAGTLPIIQI